MIALRGLTWDHPRAHEGLLAETLRFNAAGHGIHLSWDRHSLRRFEEAPLAEIAADYDLVIFDHPFVGDAAGSGCLLDLTPHAAMLGLPEIAQDSLGPSFATYSYAGAQWALPIDAACQTAACRADLLSALGEAVPETIEQALALAGRHPIAMALAVPHAFMNHLSLCGLMGEDIAGRPDRLVDLHASAEAVGLQRRLIANAPSAAFDWSSIGLLAAMAQSNAIAYAPLVFCFNTYSRPVRQLPGERLDFRPPPRILPGPGGSVIGGAGLAVSASTANREASLTVLSHFMGREVHRRMAIDGGQPGRRSAWKDDAADRANGGFFSGVGKAVEASRTRPRHPGYIAFQNAAGELLRSAMRDPAMSPRQVAESLQALYLARPR